MQGVKSPARGAGIDRRAQVGRHVEDTSRTALACGCGSTRLPVAQLRRRNEPCLIQIESAARTLNAAREVKSLNPRGGGRIVTGPAFADASGAA